MGIDGRRSQVQLPGRGSLSDDNSGNAPIQPTKDQGESMSGNYPSMAGRSESRGTNFEEVDELGSDAGEGGVWMRVM